MPINIELAALLDQYSEQLIGMGVPLPGNPASSEDQIHSELESIFGADLPDDYLTWFTWTSTLGIDEGLVPAELIPYMIVASTARAKASYRIWRGFFESEGTWEAIPPETKRWIGLNSGNDRLTILRHETPFVEGEGGQGCYRVCDDWVLHQHRPEEGFYPLRTDRESADRVPLPRYEHPLVTLTQWAKALVRAAPTFHFEELAPTIHHVLPREPTFGWPWAIPLDDF